jgi:hypothetical protein
MNLKEFSNNKNIKAISFYNQTSLEKILIFSLALKENINDIKIEVIPMRGSSKYFVATWIEGEEKTKQDTNKFIKTIYGLKSIIKSSSVFIKT